MISTPSAIEVPAPADDDERYWSVTELIKVINKPSLLYWAANETAKLAAANPQELVSRIRRDGAQRTIKWLANARNYPPPGTTKNAMDLGTAVHAAIETYVITGSWPDFMDPEVVPYTQVFDAWAQIWQPEVTHSEATIYNSDYKYAGTADAFMKIKGIPLIADYKTSRKDGPAYPEVALQLAAYRYGTVMASWQARRASIGDKRCYLMNPEESTEGNEIPSVEGGIVIKISPSSCVAYPVKCDEQVFKSFLHVTETARWSMGHSSGVIGRALKANDDLEERIKTFVDPDRPTSPIKTLPDTGILELPLRTAP